MTLLAWEARSVPAAAGVAIVPVEIVDIAAEANVRALAEEVPEQEVAAVETPPEPEPPAATPAPSPQPQPRQQPRQRDDEFSLSDISGLLDKQREPGRRQQEGERADRTQRGAGLGTAEVASIEARVAALVRRHMLRCWRAPLDQPEPERLRVTVEFELNRNGTLNGQPRVVRPTNYAFDAPMGVAVASAVRAVRECEPFPFPDDPVVGEHYEIWRSQSYNFNPTQ